MEMRLKENDLWGLIASYAHLSTYYENVNSKTALSYASKMYDVAIRQNSTPDQLEALQKLIALDNPVKAKEYYRRYLRLNDSLQNAKQIAKNQFAKIKYDSDKNREENSQLKISTANKELEIQKGKTANVLLFTSGSTIFITLLIFIYYKRKKHQIEKRVEVYKTEERISKKIHDEIANNMVNIMNKVQYTENPKDALLDDLEKVYLLTRDISHQNNSIETGAYFEPFLKSMLTSFNSNTTTVILKDIQKVGMDLIAKEKQIELYRILQELMVNMRKHSEATLVAITFKVDKNQLHINYSDNGKGLDLKELKFKNGLKNVETRIKSIPGTIIFESSLNNGFKAFISFKK
jgi:signal transduction histidine kinase